MPLKQFLETLIGCVFLNFSWVKSCVVEETIGRAPQTIILDVFLPFSFNRWDLPKAKTQEKPLEEELYQTRRLEEEPKVGSHQDWPAEMWKLWILLTKPCAHGAVSTQKYQHIFLNMCRQRNIFF